MTWILAASLFNYGYFLVYITQVPTITLQEIYHINLDEGVTESLLNGIMPAGGLLGAIFGLFFIRLFSRRYTCSLLRNNLYFINALCFAASWVIFIKSFPVLILCRFLQGLSAGFLTTIIPLMIK
jgi:MFS family permease